MISTLALTCFCSSGARARGPSAPQLRLATGRGVLRRCTQWLGAVEARCIDWLHHTVMRLRTTSSSSSAHFAPRAAQWPCSAAAPSPFAPLPDESTCTSSNQESADRENREEQAKGREAALVRRRRRGDVAAVTVTVRCRNCAASPSVTCVQTSPARLLCSVCLLFLLRS